MKHATLFAVAFVALVLTRIATAPPIPNTEDTAPTATTQAHNVSYEAALRDLHAHLGRRYPNFQMKDIDWNAVGEELLPQAAAVRSDEEFGLLCMKLVARLEDSHARLLPGTAALPRVALPEWDVGLACVQDDRLRPVVFHVDANGPADDAGIRPGMVVVSINGSVAEDAVRDWMRLAATYWGYSSERALRYDAMRMFHRQMTQGVLVTLELEDLEGNRRSVQLPALVGTRYVPRLPVPTRGIRDASDISWTRLPDQIGYIYVRRIRDGLPELLDVAVRELGDTRGLIIDVRGNSGGGFDGKRALRNFDPDDPEEGDRPRYTKPIALLIDERCISAGEGWASWFVTSRRARLFGTATSGASARRETYTLTNGLYQVTFPVRARSGFLNRPIERRGLEPDVEVRPKAADLAAGRDTVRETARQYLLQSGE